MAALCAAGCAAPDAEIHLAPFFSRHTVPGYDHAELAAGIVRHDERDDRESWALSPLIWHQRASDGKVLVDFLYPLGRYQSDPSRPRTYARLFPIFWREAETRGDGVLDTDWVLLPFFFGGSSSDGKENYLGVFPIYGKARNFFTYDEWRFALWPLWSRTEKDGRFHHHILWPFFGWNSGNGASGFHVWPLYGKSELEGHYKRSYFLWPIYSHTEEGLERKHPTTGWLVLPLAGRIRRDDYVATTALWPIFGSAKRPSTGYRAWRVWPLLKFERAPEDHRSLSKVLPFYLHFQSEHTEYRSWLWPILWQRHDTIGGRQRDSFLAIPLYFASRTIREDGRRNSKWRVWPLVRSERDDDGSGKLILPAPGIEPVLESEALSRNLGFAFEIWADRRDAGEEGIRVRSRRAFLDLYHSSEGGGHRRWSIPFLGGRWTEPDGTTHTSLLMGLLRWSSGPRGRGLEDPAFPGPGWPDLHARGQSSPEESP